MQRAHALRKEEEEEEGGAAQSREIEEKGGGIQEAETEIGFCFIHSLGCNRATFW